MTMDAAFWLYHVLLDIGNLKVCASLSIGYICSKVIRIYLGLKLAAISVSLILSM
jgi:hypothetical protein